MAFLSLARGELVYHASMPVLRASLSNQTCGLKLATTYSHTSYDAVGNRTSSHLSSSYTYSSFNRLTATQTASYAYDNNGAMTSRTDANGTINFGHDSDGRLINSYDDQFNLSEYRYDALGRRIYYWNPYQVPYEYTYDGHDVLVSYYGGSPTKYQNGPGIDNKLSVRIAGSGGSLYYLQDHLGTTFGTTDSSRAFSSWGLMDSFGRSDGDFTGREYDSFNSLYYYRARMYDPDLGRFTAEDPIGFSGGDINLYGYVRNQPLRFRDPLGLFPAADITSQPAIWAAGAALAAKAKALLAGAGALTGAAASSPAVVAGVGFGAGYAIGYYPGQWTANHPSNPFVNGPLNPFGTPVPLLPPFPITPPVTSTGSQPYCIPMSRIIPFPTPKPGYGSLPPPPPPSDRPTKCQNALSDCLASSGDDLIMQGKCAAAFNACMLGLSTIFPNGVVVP